MDEQKKKLNEKNNTANISTEKAVVSYSNLCRGITTPEEVILDFAVSPNAFGRMVNENIEVHNRIVLSYPTAKRLLYLLNDLITRHEKQYGEVKTDTKRVNRTAQEAQPAAAV